MCASLYRGDNGGAALPLEQEAATIGHCRASQDGSHAHSSAAQRGRSRRGVAAPWRGTAGRKNISQQQKLEVLPLPVAVPRLPALNILEPHLASLLMEAILVCTRTRGLLVKCAHALH